MARDQEETVEIGELSLTARVTDALNNGEAEVLAILDLPTVPHAQKPGQFAKLAADIHEATPPRGHYQIVVMRRPGSRQELEEMIVRLRMALERNADPEDGYAEIEDADAFEASRVLVPDRDEEELAINISVEDAMTAAAGAVRAAGKQ